MENKYLLIFKNNTNKQIVVCEGDNYEISLCLKRLGKNNWFKRENYTIVEKKK